LQTQNSNSIREGKRIEVSKYLHSDDIAFWVASDMEPGTRIDKGRIPTLEDISRVIQC
jgi:hypothetical protein